MVYVGSEVIMPPIRPCHDLTGIECSVVAENQGGILMVVAPRVKIVDIGLADLFTIRDGHGGTTRYYVTARTPAVPMAGGARHPSMGAIYGRFAGLDRDRRYMEPPPPPGLLSRAWGSVVALFRRK